MLVLRFEEVDLERLYQRLFLAPSLRRNMSLAASIHHKIPSEQDVSSHSVSVAAVCADAPSKKRKQCQNCGHNAAIYTCPRCSFQSCSLACTKAHKYRVSPSLRGPQTVEACSGVKENNAGGYVNMEEYGYTSFVTDYVFLEDIGRKAGEWGKDIQAKLGGTSNNTHRHPKTKRELLKENLEDLEIDMELLPQGMQRRKVNQSTWDTNSQKPFLTVGYRFHQRGFKESVDFLTHRNELHMRIGEGLRKAVAERKKGALPDWVRKLVGAEDDGRGESGTESFRVSMKVAIPRELGSSKLKNLSKDELLKRRIVEVDTEATLEDALKGTSFVEFPTLEVTALEGVLEQMKGGGETDEDEVEDEEVQRPMKRPKIDVEARQKLLGRLAAYGSEDGGSTGGENDESRAAVDKVRGFRALQALDYESDSSEEEDDQDANSANEDDRMPSRTGLGSILG